MYDIKTTEAVKDFATVVNLNNKFNNVKVTFDIIKCKEELTEKEIDYLGIIRSDIYYLVHKLYDKVVIVTDWSDHDIYASYQMITEHGPYYFPEKTPIFFVIGCNYPFTPQHIGTLCRHGFYQADHLVNLENNCVLVRTNSLKEFDTMNKLYYAKVLEFESHSASDIEPVKTETESATELKKEVRELKKEQFEHLSTSDEYKNIRKAIDDKKSKITDISDKEQIGAKNYTLKKKCTTRDLVKFIRSYHTGYPMGNFKITDGVVDELFSDRLFSMWLNFTPISYTISRNKGSGVIRIDTKEFRRYYDISNKDWININKLMTPASGINEVIKKFYTNRLTKSEAMPYITDVLNPKDDNKAEIAIISDKELEEAKFAPDLEVANLWFKRFLDEGIDPEEYIEELEDAIENEKLWIKGSRTDEEKYMHETNISTLERAIKLVKGHNAMKDKKLVTVGTLKEMLKDVEDYVQVMFSLGVNENGEIGYTSIDSIKIVNSKSLNRVFIALDNSYHLNSFFSDKTDMTVEEIIGETKFDIIRNIM